MWRENPEDEPQEAAKSEVLVDCIVGAAKWGLQEPDKLKENKIT